MLVLGALSADELPVALAAGAELVAWDERFVDDLVAAARRGRCACTSSWTRGMGRLRDPRSLRDALAVADAASPAAAPMRTASWPGR